MDNGKYEAVTQSASVYEKEGKLMLAVEFRVGDELLKSFFVLVKADGMANEGVIRGIRDWSGWDGIDPYWIQDNAGAEWPCEVTVAWEPGFKDPSKSFLNIKWVNKIGSSGNMPESSDRSAIMARFGSKLRSVAGPQSVANGRHTPVKTSAPASPPARNPPPAPTRPPPGGVKHTQASCWDALQAVKPNASQEEVVALWYSLIAERDQATMTSADWANVAEAIGQLSVHPATTDHEPMPF